MGNCKVLFLFLLPFILVDGEDDFGLESNRKAERLIKERGVRVQLVVYEGLGHAFPPNGGEELKKALKWIELAE